MWPWSSGIGAGTEGVLQWDSVTPPACAQSAVLAAALRAARKCASKGTAGSGVMMCTWRRVFLTLERWHLIYVLGHGMVGSLHICVHCKDRRNWEISYRQGKRNSNSTTGYRLFMIQEIMLLFSLWIVSLSALIASVLLFSHLLDLPYGRSNKVTPPLPCSTSPVFPVSSSYLVF